MPRFKLTIEYDGTPFVGWQRQENGPSVQQAIEEAAAAYCQTEIVVHGAGRTDAGVHAKAQVAHVDLPRDDGGDKVRDALNAHLRSSPIAIVQAEQVSEEFHARFSAIKRHYLYRIVMRRGAPGLGYKAGMVANKTTRCRGHVSSCSCLDWQTRFYIFSRNRMSGQDPGQNDRRYYGDPAWR